MPLISSYGIMLIRLEGKSQIVEQELVRLGEQRVQTSEGTRAMALELCREFEDTFLQHINTGEVGDSDHLYYFGVSVVPGVLSLHLTIRIMISL